MLKAIMAASLWGVVVLVIGSATITYEPRKRVLGTLPMVVAIAVARRKATLREADYALALREVDMKERIE